MRPILLVAVIALTAHAQLPEGEGKAVVQRVCTRCHDLEATARSRNTREGWAAIVDDMASKGAEATDSEFAQIVDYLARNFPRAKAAAQGTAEKVNVNQAAAAALTSALEISKERAEAIVEYREKNGPYKEWRDLAKVPGIDMKQIEDKKDQLEF